MREPWKEWKWKVPLESSQTLVTFRRVHILVGTVNKFRFLLRPLHIGREVKAD